MPQWMNIARWVHILASAAWFGEIAMMAFVLVPHAVRLPKLERLRFISQIFPRVSHLASWFVIVSLGSGLWLNFLLTGCRNMEKYLLSAHGMLILVGGLAGSIVAIIHFLVATQIETRLGRSTMEQRLNDQLLILLNVIPKVGLFLISAAFVTMMIAARGF